MNITVQMRGLDQLSLSVKYLQRAAVTGLKFGVQEAAALFENEEKLLVPVRTGALRDSIHTETTLDTDEKQQRVVSPDTPYAGYVEYGTYKMAAQPYVRPSYDMHKDEAAEAIKESVYSELDTAMNKVAANRRR